MLFSVGEMIFTTKRKEKKKKLQFIAPSSFKQHSIDYRNNWKYRKSYILYHMSMHVICINADTVEYLFFTYSAVYYTGILRINIYVLDMF